MNDLPTENSQAVLTEPKPQKKDADYVFYELTRASAPIVAR